MLRKLYFFFKLAHAGCRVYCIMHIRIRIFISSLTVAPYRGAVTVIEEFVVRLLQSAPGALHSQYAVRKREDFRWRLNVAVDDRMTFSSVGRRFHARVAATENCTVINSPLGSRLEEVAVAKINVKKLP